MLDDEFNLQTYCDNWQDIPLKEMCILAQVKRDSKNNSIIRDLLQDVIIYEKEIYINNEKFTWEEIKEELT